MNEFDWDVGTVRFTSNDKGFVGVQVGLFGEDAGASSPDGETHYPYGMYARPHDPETDDGCSALYAWSGNELHVLPTYDRRVVPKLPALKKGESCTFGGNISKLGFAHFSDKDTWTLYVPVEESNGTVTKAHIVTAGLAGNGKRMILLGHADGMSISMIEGGKNSVVIKNKAGNAYLELNDDGIVQNGNTKAVGSLEVGVNPAAPVPGFPVVMTPELVAWSAAVALACQSKGITIPPFPGPGTTMLKAR